MDVMNRNLITIALDFDGVVHDTPKTRWPGNTIIAGPPMPGAIVWLRDVLVATHPAFSVIIHTARFADPVAYPDTAHFHDGEPKAAISSAIRQWFVSNGLEPELVKLLRFHDSRGKPPAHLYLDDKGFRFTGDFGAVSAMLGNLMALHDIGRLR